MHASQPIGSKSIFNVTNCSLLHRHEGSLCQTRTFTLLFIARY